MIQRLSDLTKGILGLAATLALLVGVPLALAAAIGWPLPTAWPDLDTVGRHVTNGDIPDPFVIKLIATIVWVAWAQLAAATLVEYTSILRGKAATRTPALPAVRLLAAKLATWTTLIVSAIAPMRPALAAPLHPVAAAAIVPTVAQSASDPVPSFLLDEPAALATAKYRTERGDTWWDIAETLLGDGMRWHEIRNLNLDRPMPDGTVVTAQTDMVNPGWHLTVPAESQLPPNNKPSEGADAGTVVVEPGDHFWAIAEETLTQAWGRSPTDAEIAPYWVELVQANEDRLLPPEDPNLIYPDQTFVLPEPPPGQRIAVDLNGTSVLDPPPAVVVEPASEEQPPPREVAEDETADPAAESSNAEVPQAPSVPAENQTPDGGGGLAELLDEAKPIGVVAAGLAFLGGALLFTLRRLRRIQAARRRPTATIDPPDNEAAAVEQRIRAISTDGEDVRYLAAANAYLSHKLEHAVTPVPSIIAAMAGEFGLEFLLDEPCEPVDGFDVSTEDKTAWRLQAHVDVEMMEQATVDDAHPFAPALCVAGSTPAGSILLDLEQLAAVSVEGAPDQVLDLQRALVASACVAPWAEQCEIVTIGIDGIGSEHLSRATTPDEPHPWAQQLATRMTGIARNLDRSPYEERIAHGEVHYPTIVFIGPDSSLAGIAQHLGPVAQLAYAPLVVVAGHALAGGYRISLADSEGILEPFGLAFEPVRLPAEDLAAIDRLVANASETTASPPATEWAEEIAQTDRVPSNGLGQPEASDEAAHEPEVRDEGGTVVRAEPSHATIDAISAILEPKPIEVRILGRQACIAGLGGDPTPKIGAIIAYMAFQREVVGQRLRDEFWPGSDNRQACDNAMVKARALLGTTTDGTQRLETIRATNSYRISDEVGLDWQRVEALIAASKDQPPADEAAYLDAACELIDGHVAADARTDLYGWLLRDPTTYTLIETTLVDAAHRRGQLALASGDVERANWAAQKGLEIVEGQESMYRMKMEAASEAGDLDGVNAAYRQAQRAAESYGFDEEVQPETHALFEKLTRGGRAVGRPGSPHSSTSSE